MNSFFATCEQQDKMYLRDRPVVVSGRNKNSVIIAPSVEAKTLGIKTGMRLNVAKLIFPDLISVSVSSNIYRKYHRGIVGVLKRYSDDVLPKSIDEAVLNLSSYKYIYPDSVKIAKAIKSTINNDVGDWLQCSIGIAPNVFLAKLATNLQKPDGLVVINEENIDGILSKLKLTDLPGIADRMARRLSLAGIKNPLEMKRCSAEVLRKVMGGVVGYYWYCRLNFYEVDFRNPDLQKSMSAVRTLSRNQRSDISIIKGILLGLCMKLESRLMKHGFFCKSILFSAIFSSHSNLELKINLKKPLQDGSEIFNLIFQKIEEKQLKTGFEVFSSTIKNLGVVLNHFVSDKHIQYELFDNSFKKDKVRKTVYEIKNNFGSSKIFKAVEMTEKEPIKDIIGFGSIRDIDV